MPRQDTRSNVQRYLEIRSNQIQETKDVIAAFAVARNDAMAQIKATCEQIHLNESFYKQAPVDQSQPFAECLQQLFISRMQQVADVNFFTDAIQEQQKNLQTLTQLATLYEESGVIAQCDKCCANIRPTELDQCRPVTTFFAILLCPACSTQAGTPAA